MANEITIRLGVFFGVFALMAICEALLPRRKRNLPRSGRWITNWGISLINSGVTVAMKLILGAAAVAAALDASAEGWGLLNIAGAPQWLAVLAAFIVLDFAIWFQHLASHKIPLLWRLHRVHHADRDIDVTTAIRFHPIEIALSMLFKILVIYAIGAPALGVILFEIVLNGAAMFNHANVRLGGVDRWLRLAIVTPDMHRVHHSIYRREHDANYGFNLSIWDRMFGTYIAQPEEGHEGMTIGLADQQSEKPANLFWSLGFPFQKL